MLDKQCFECGIGMVGDELYCATCQKAHLEKSTDLDQSSAIQISHYPSTNPVYISYRRIVILSIVSLGLYIFYWLFYTWKQIHQHSERQNFPVWHALAFLIPIFGLFVIYSHMAVIQELANSSGASISLKPAMAVVLCSLSWMLSVVAAGEQNLVMAMLVNTLALVITTVLPVWGQSTLNQCWTNTQDGALVEVPLSRVETSVMILGIAYWATILYRII